MARGNHLHAIIYARGGHGELYATEHSCVSLGTHLPRRWYRNDTNRSDDRGMSVGPIPVEGGQVTGCEGQPVELLGQRESYIENRQPGPLIERVHISTAREVGRKGDRM